MSTINPELFQLARRAMFEKSAVVPPMGGDPAAMGGGDPAAMGAAAPVQPGQAPPAADPNAAAMGGAPAPAAPPGMVDPSMMGALPPAQPAAAPAAGQQKLKPEQMMQMLDYRLYNMQQQLTAIMNAMGVQVAPESLVLPPGTTGAPPAETALPGGPMAPPPPDPNAAAQGGAAPGGAAPPGGPLPPGGPMPPNAPPVDPSKQAAWWDAVDAFSASRIGTPVSADLLTKDEPIAQSLPLYTKASAIAALHKSLSEHVG